MSKQLLRTSGSIAIGTLLSRTTGLFRVWATVEALGIGPLSDTYNSANSTPNLIYELLLGGVLTATLVPLFVDLNDRDDRDGISAVFTTALLALLATSVAAFVCAPWVVRLLSSQVGPIDHADSVRLGTTLLRCFALQILGYGFTALASAALNARGKFLAAAYAPVLNNVIVSLVLLLAANGTPSLSAVSSDTNLSMLIGLGTTAGIIATAVALLLALRQARISFRPVWQPTHVAVKRIVRSSGWTLGYVVANQIALLVVMIIARDIPGALASYQFALIFFQLPHGLVAVSIMTSLLPELSRRAHNNDLAGLSTRFGTGLSALLVFIAPASAGLFVLATPLVDAVLTTGSTSPTSTATALSGFAFGLVPFSVYLYCLRCFYALGDTRTPFLINCVENALNVGFALVAFNLWGVRGLSGSFSAAYAVAALISLFVLRRGIGSFITARSERAFAVVILGSATCAGVAWLIAAMTTSPVIGLAGGVVGAAATYALVLRLLAFADIRALFVTDDTDAKVL